MRLNPEQLIDLLVERIQKNADVSDLTKDQPTESLINLMEGLSRVPKINVPQADFAGIKDKVLDRIAVPDEAKESDSWYGLFMQQLPRLLKVGSGLVGGFLILASMSVATVASALESVPGQPIYPVKMALETVQYRFASSDAEKAQLQIRFANNRLEELEKVLNKSRDGKVSGATIQKVVQNAVDGVNSLNSSIPDSTKSDTESPEVGMLTKIVDLNQKQEALLKTASIQTEGEVKIEVDKAIEATKISKDQAIANMQRAGLVVEDNPIVIEGSSLPQDQVSARGQVTAFTETTLNLGTARFFLTKDTIFVNMNQADLKIGQVVDIKGRLDETKTYAESIQLIQDIKTQPEQEIQG